MDERIKVLEGCKYIDKIIPNAPLKITDEYIKLYNINKIFIPNNRNTEDNILMLSNIHTLVDIIQIEYTNTISTTDIINRIKNYN